MGRPLLVALLASAACGSSGSAPWLTALDRDSHAPHFPIAAGPHQAAGCNDCHGAFDTFTRFTCLASGCHAQGQADATHAGLAGYAWDSAECLRCHPRGESDFEHRFPIGAGTNHVDRTCSGCHPGATRKEFSCLGCHAKPETDANHSAVAGYAYESPKCLACHPTGEAGSVEHAKYFPIAQGEKHAGVGCSECHTNPATRKVTTCNACHAHPAATVGARHGAVGGYDAASAQCLRCHADSQVHRVAAHLPFAIDASSDHYRTSCLACHPRLRADKAYGADFARARIDCLACHSRADMDDRHSGEAGYRYESLSCIQGGCHADGRKPED